MATAATAAGPAVVDDDGPGRFWWIPLVAGLLSLVVGVVALAYPGPTLLVVGILFGAYLAAWGTMLIVSCVRGDAAPTFARILGVIVGLLGVLAGLILLVRPGESVLTAALVLGFWWVLTGVMQLARGIASPEGRTWNVLLGTLGLVAGTIILAQPDIGLIFQGLVEIAAGWGIRRLHKEGLA